jgi:hypothetical protein
MAAVVYTVHEVYQRYTQYINCVLTSIKKEFIKDVKGKVVPVL